MATNGKADMDKIDTEAYILRWQQLRRERQRAEQITYFFLIPTGSAFTLPGGVTQQVKTSPRQAETAGGLRVSYYDREEVVPLCGQCSAALPPSGPCRCSTFEEDEAIPFQGEPMPGKEATLRDYYGL